MRALLSAARNLLIATLMGGLVAACTTTDFGPKQTVGTLAGAAGGAILGSNVGKGKGQIAAVAVGTLLGAYVGSEIGKSLDAADRAALQQAHYNALETAPAGQQVEWRNPDSGNHGYVTPTRTYQTSQNQYCREYQQIITVGGKTESAYGTACRQPDGSWKIVNS